MPDVTEKENNEILDSANIQHQVKNGGTCWFLGIMANALQNEGN
jgi:hypothetical protein